MSDDEGWFSLSEMRPIYLEAGTNVRVVGWANQPDGRQPIIECQAYDRAEHKCTIYARRPKHCRDHDCRDDDWSPDWRARPHCLITRRTIDTA